MPTEAPKKRATKILTRLPPLVMLIKDMVAIDPIKSHTFRALALARGKSFEPSTDVIATLMK